MRLYLVRHAQTGWNIEGRAQGHTDIPLDEIGREQARLLGIRFEGVKLDRILTSDLLRARETAQAIADATCAPLDCRFSLRERSFGEWEGTPFATVGDRMIEESVSRGIPLHEVRPPGGESYADVWARLQPIVEELASSDETLAIVSHGGSSALLLSRLLLGTPETSRSFSLGNTSVTEIFRRPDGYYRLVKYDGREHLLSGELRAESGELRKRNQ